jgi:hypothetical protein
LRKGPTKKKQWKIHGVPMKTEKGCAALKSEKGTAALMKTKKGKEKQRLKWKRRKEMRH